jgi:hypothetical protein
MMKKNHPMKIFLRRLRKAMRPQKARPPVKVVQTQMDLMEIQTLAATHHSLTRETETSQESPRASKRSSQT